MTDRPFPTSEVDVEARTEPRRQVGWRGQIVTEDGRRLAVRIVDISSTGAGFVGDDKLALRQPVILEVQVPRLPDMDGHTIERWRATVAFQMFKGRTLRSGVKFQDLRPEQQALLEAWVGRRQHAR
ncbi:MAG: PilZ domain-containing protein [Burkholderiaceae bacterium]|nr:PilZ domain-containing protein [Burkholderiaceae bacterium]